MGSPGSGRFTEDVMGGLGKLPIGRHRGTKSSNPASLQRRVRVSRDFALPRREGGFSRGCVGPAGAAWSAETAIARCMAPTGGNISVGPNSSTAASMRWSTPLAPSPHWQCSGFVIRLRRCQCVSSCPKRGDASALGSTVHGDNPTLWPFGKPAPPAKSSPQRQPARRGRAPRSMKMVRRL